MLILRRADDLQWVADETMRNLLRERMDAVGDGDVFDADVHGDMLVVQDADTLTDIVYAGVPVSLQGAENQLVFELPFEVLEEHTEFFDMVFVLNDGSMQLTVLVPKHAMACPALLAFCQINAVPVPEEAIDV